MSTAKKPFEDYRQALTDKIVARMEAGIPPWQKPWDASKGVNMRPHNVTSGKNYRGMNAIVLSMQNRSDPRWMTYKQAQEKGWQVRKGEKGTTIEYWKFPEASKPKTKTIRPEGDKPLVDPTTSLKEPKGPTVFYSTVFNAAQIEGIPAYDPAKNGYEWEPKDRAEQILQSSGASIFHDQNNQAFYRPTTDTIHLPSKTQFSSPEKYYSTALHELGHWTGHESRFDRLTSKAPFGSEEYAREELRAELASYFLADKLGISYEPDGHAAYISSWIKVLKKDKNEIFRASRDAELICDYVMSLDRDRNKIDDSKQSVSNEIEQEIQVPQLAGLHIELLRTADWQVRSSVENDLRERVAFEMTQKPTEPSFSSKKAISSRSR